MKVIKTKTAAFSIDKRGFLKITFLDNTEDIDEHEVYEHIKAAEILTGNKKMAVLADVRLGIHNANSKAKETIAAYKMKKAEAIIINSLPQRIVANFYLRISNKINNKFPVKLFTNEKDAVRWLTQYV